MLLSSLLSGLIGAVVGSVFSLIILFLERKRDIKKSKIIAFSLIEKIIAEVKRRELFIVNEPLAYYTIFESIEFLEYYEKSLLLIKVHTFCLPSGLIIVLNDFDRLLNGIINNYYSNVGNDEYSLMEDSASHNDRISKIIADIHKFLEVEYKKLNWH